MLVRYISACAASLLVMSGSFFVQAQEAGRGWDPPLETRAALSVQAEGGGGASIELRENDYVGLVVAPGFRSAEDLCVSSLNSGFDVAELERAAAAWHIEARLVELRQGEATIDLRWTRRVNRADLRPSESITSEQRLVLRQGDSRILDLVRTTRRPAPKCESFALTFEVRFEGPRELSDAAIAYDLWLVQRDGDGELVTDRYQVTGRQGQQVEYFFRPVAYTADGRRTDAAAAINMNVFGAIRGRVRSDGNIDLMVDGSRWFTDAASTSSTGTKGRTLLTVRPGETIEVSDDLPVGDSLKQVFGKHRTAIRVTATRRW